MRFLVQMKFDYQLGHNEQNNHLEIHNVLKGLAKVGYFFLNVEYYGMFSIRIDVHMRGIILTGL